MKRVAVIPGSSTVTEHVVNLMQDISRLELRFEHFPGTELLSDEQLKAVASCDGALFGKVLGGKSSQQQGQEDTAYKSPIIDLRKRLQLTNIVYSVDDVVLVREATHDDDTAEECLLEGGQVATWRRSVTRDACVRAAHFALQLAASRRAGDDRLLESFKRGGPAAVRPAKVTVAHKANVFAVTEGLFLDCVREVHEQHYPDILLEEKKADAVASELIVPQTRANFDVILATNLFGDVLGDVCAGVQGGLAYSAAASVSSDNEFILAHSTDVITSNNRSAADNQGETPFGSFRAASMLLGHLGDALAAHALDRAISAMLQNATQQQGTLAEVTDRLVVRAEQEAHKDDISQE